MNKKIEIKSDFLVIGSGIAGLIFAIKASDVGTVSIVTKKDNFESNTNYAQGGIASVLSPLDSYQAHIDDTIKAGCHLGNIDAIKLLVTKGPLIINELISWGTKFSFSENPQQTNELDLGKEGGHSSNRIVHAQDLTGKEIERSLLKKISEIKNIQMFEDHTAIDILTEHQLQIASDTCTCYGAYILDNKTGDVITFKSKITHIASGGIGQVYNHTTNPSIATGDGIAMAYRAGAIIADMEFIQFHPTTLFTKKKEGRVFLISEAVRGEGAILLNSRMHKIMENAHHLKDLAPRDIVARTIDYELKKSGDDYVYLDIRSRGKKFLEKRFPGIFEQCLKQGIDISKDLIPVVPAAHYLCGGISSDINGRSSINNLYVSGESACTGVHGANRLASNSLLEGAVFSDAAFNHSSKKIKNGYNFKETDFPYWSKGGTSNLKEKILISHNIEGIKILMRDYVGIVRSDTRLKLAYKRILDIADEIPSEVVFFML